MGLTADQSIAINNPRRHKLVVALPGSGKTHMSISLCESIIKTVPDAYLACVTFTNASTNETRERLQSKVGWQNMARCEVSTFARLMKMHAAPLIKKRRLILGAEQQMMVNRVAKRFNDINADECAFSLDQQMRELLADGYGYALEHGNKYLRAYIELMGRYGKYDLTMMACELVYALEHGEIAPMDFSHVIVDEFQDTDILQYRWLKAHHSEMCVVTVVGDDDQSIYSWRGAMGVDNMTRFQNDFDAMGVLLRICFRCAPTVLIHAKRLIEHNSHRLEKDMKTAKDSGGSVVYREINANEIESDFLEAGKTFEWDEWVTFGENGEPDDEEKKRISLLNQDPSVVVAKEISQDPKNVAILARTNKKLDAMEQELSRMDIPAVRIGGKSIWDNMFVIGYVKVLATIANPFSIAHLDQALAFLGEREDTINNIHQQAEQGRSFMAASKSTDGKNIWKHKTEKLYNLAEKAINEGRNANSISNILSELRNIVIITKDDANKLKSTVTWINNFILRLDGDFKSRVKHLVKQASQQKQDEVDHSGKDKVVLSTLNGSKGLQWPKVWIIDVEKNVIPSKQGFDGEDYGGPHTEEERRLLYVGMTRAEESLTLSFRAGKQSPFVIEARGF